MTQQISIASFPTIAVDWLITNGIAIVLILAGAYVVQRFASYFLERVIRRTIRTGTPEDERMREDTLIRITRQVVRLSIWLIALLMALSQAGIDIGPLLAAAGIAGVAVGFGAQYFIRDVVAGLFIIIENQYRVGDVVCLDSTCGLVEDISVRKATLRDLDGTVHNIPHGAVQKVSNMSKDFARVNLDVGVGYGSDLEEVIACINDVGKELAADPKWGKFITAAPHFERVNDFGDSAIVVKILGETKPLQQWAVTGELRKRLKIAFDKKGIEIPFPQRTVWQAS